MKGAGMYNFISGAYTIASFAVALFFLRFWKKSCDRIFGALATAFVLFAVERIILLSEGIAAETKYAVYMIRFVAHLIIIGGIVDKNLRRK